MITIKEIEERTRLILNQGNSSTLDKKTANKNKKAVQQLKECRIAIENGMTEEKVQRQILQVEEYLKKCEEIFPKWSKPTLDMKSSKRSAFNREFGIVEKKKQLKFLKMLKGAETH